MTAGESPVDVQARLDGLTERAQAATPGPWLIDGPFWVDPPGVTPTELTVQTRAGVTGADRTLVAEGTWDTSDANMAHIAGADPETVLWLVEQVETLRAENEMKERLLATMDHFADVAETCERKANESHARRESAEAERDRAVQRADDLTAKVGALADDCERTGERLQGVPAAQTWLLVATRLRTALDCAVPAPPQDQPNDEAPRCICDDPPVARLVLCPVHGRQQDGGADETKCSTCGGSFDSPPCSLNRDLGVSGHTGGGGRQRGEATR